MKYKKLGNTKLNVSLICLGTMTYGEQNTAEEGFEQMDYALDKGINFFDTAELYAIPPKAKTYGKTEEIIGNWFQKRKNREKVILASKIAGPGLKWIRGGGEQYSEKSIEDAVNSSLKRLKTDYIDLYQLHWPERNTNYFGDLDYGHDANEKKWNRFENILKVASKNVDQNKNDRFLDFLAIETIKMPDKNYEMNLIFSGDVVLKLVAEAIEVTLDDQGSPWESKNKPEHKDL